MHPKVQLIPKRLGVQGPSKTKKNSSSSSSSKRFSPEELREIRRLATVLPAVARPKKVDSEETIQMAAAYIQQLVATVHARVANGTLSPEVLSTLPPQHAVPPRRTTQTKKKPSIEKKR